MKGRIIGIGGVFWKTKNTDQTKDWYTKNLGLKTNQWGASFVNRKVSDPQEYAFLQWSLFGNDSDYFGDKGQQFMINYRVENIEGIVADFKEKGFTVCKEIESYEYGKFVHVEDIDGLRMELWEPIDKVFDEMLPDKNEANIE